MAKETAMIYLWLKKRIGTFERTLFFLRAPAMCAIFPVSVGMHAACVERTELQSILEYLEFLIK